MHVRQEKEVSFTGFLLYLLHRGTVDFGGPIPLTNDMESDVVAEGGWIEGWTLEGSAFAPSSDLKRSGATVLQSRNARTT